MKEVWLGQLFDGRVLLPSDPEPVDHPKPRWKHVWRCTTRKCGAPSGVACRCQETA